ncbi:MAG: type II toxin-antitoxin system RelE/ParE family toxin [Flavobacteriales bacterium]|nr:type II toxin-antitoxin system RelE/ParE family toxin [Flavobacteriales bacterium]
MKVVWTQKAEISFNSIIDYLLESWSTEIATKFVNLVEHTIDMIVANPEMFKISEFDDESREALITKHTTMFYRILENEIEIVYFWGNFDNPKKIKSILGVEENETAYLLKDRNGEVLLESIRELEKVNLNIK